MTGPGRGVDPTLVAEVVGILGDAEAVGFVSVDDELGYLDRRARLLHRLVDVLGDEQSRYLAQDADDRASGPGRSPRPAATSVRIAAAERERCSP